MHEKIVAATSADAALTAPGRVFPVSAPDSALARIRDLIHRVCGIYFPDNKLYFLRDRCAHRVAAVAASFAEYCDLLTSGPDREAEVRRLLNEITISETSFFRNKPQLAALRKIVLPKLAEANARLSFNKIRLWSAGCSTGEEAYALAMILLEESEGLLKGWSWELIATDLNDNAIAHARQGIYDSYALRNVDASLREKYFTPCGPNFAISPELARHVTFNRLNLRDESKLLFMKGLDVIFCANVLIYFDGATRRRTVHHFFNGLRPGGYLFLGQSETLYGVNDEFRPVHFSGATAYVHPPAPAASGVSR